MFNITFENKNGLQLQFGAGTPYTITEFQGLNPPKATINTNITALLDGAMFNSSKLQMRSINIAFAIESPAEENRLAVYTVIQSKMPLRIYYQSEQLDIFIDGYVEDLDFSYFAKKLIATVSVLCPFPYFKGAQEVINELSAIIPMFHFPIESEGGKNLLPYPYDYTTRTKNGVTYTDNGDGTITVNGTATAYSDFALQSRTDTNTPFTLASGTYILSGCPEGGGQSSYRLLVGITQNGAWQSIAADQGEGATFQYDPSMGNLGVVIGVTSGYTVDNVTFQPMIRYSVYSDDTWQPYDYGEIVFGEIDTLTSVEIENAGSVEAGLIFQLYARAAIKNPKVINYQTAEYFAINIEMETGDLITVTTGQGNKTITLLRDGVETNIFNLLDKNSTWLQLDIGGDVFVYEVEEGVITNLVVTISHYDLFEGV